jgi:hypothetical protein
VVIGETNRDLVEISNLLRSEERGVDTASKWIGEISKARILHEEDPEFEQKLIDANPNVAIIVLDSEKEYVVRSRSLIRDVRKKIPGLIVIGLVNTTGSEESLPIDRIESVLGVTCYEFPPPES